MLSGYIISFLSYVIILESSFKAPTGTPTNVNISVSSTSITASWDVISCRDRNGIIRYKPEFRDASGTLLIETEVSGRAFTINGLQPSTVYTFRVAAVNNGRIGPFTAVHGATTRGNVNGRWSSLILESQEEFKFSHVTNFLGVGAILQPPQPVFATMGSTASFSCAAVGNVIWEVDGEEILSPVAEKYGPLASKSLLLKYVPLSTPDYSMAVINATAQTNGTTLRCFVEEGERILNTSAPVQLFVIGRLESQLSKCS